MWLPPSATTAARRLVIARALRGFADGFVSVYLSAYLQLLGLSNLAIGAIVTATLLGSAALTLAVGMIGHRWSARHVLLWACVLMLLTGVGFAWVTNFWPLLLIAFAGTLNPSSGDVSVFCPPNRPCSRASRRIAIARRCLRATPWEERFSGRSAHWRAVYLSRVPLGLVWRWSIASVPDFFFTQPSRSQSH